jgi:hypothetical protein
MQGSTAETQSAQSAQGTSPASGPSPTAAAARRRSPLAGDPAGDANGSDAITTPFPGEGCRPQRMQGFTSETQSAQKGQGQYIPLLCVSAVTQTRQHPTQGTRHPSHTSLGYLDKRSWNPSSERGTNPNRNRHCREGQDANAMLPTLIWHLDMAPDRRSNADIRVPWSPRPRRRHQALPERSPTPRRAPRTKGA